jgi:hypothetical protein
MTSGALGLMIFIGRLQRRQVVGSMAERIGFSLFANDAAIRAVDGRALTGVPDDERTIRGGLGAVKGVVEDDFTLGETLDTGRLSHARGGAGGEEKAEAEEQATHG